MKFFGYILRNARRNPVRSLLTVASLSVCLALMMIIVSFLTINNEVFESVKIYNRIVTMSSQGFSTRVPIARVSEIKAMDGVLAATPFSWYGGSLGEERMPFAQFGIDPEQALKVYDEIKVAPEQARAFLDDPAGCLIGRKLAQDRGWKIGDRLPLKGTIYPFNLNLTIRAVYDAPPKSDQRMCWFHWEYLEEGLKRDNRGGGSGNAGVIVIKCKTADAMPLLCKKIDDAYLNSDTPTRSQTEEAFGKMFAEYWGNMRDLIRAVGLAVIFSLVCVAGNAMAMAMRERTTEMAVLKAIGFGRGLILWLVLAESVIVSAVGGLIGSFGTLAFFEVVDAGRYSGGFLPFFFIPWSTAFFGLGLSLVIGLASGIVPAVNAARLSVVDGLRKVV